MPTEIEKLQYENMSSVEIEDVILFCCQDGDLKTLEYLYETSSFKNTLDSIDIELFLLRATLFGNVNIISYFLTSKNGYRHEINPTDENDTLFVEACINDHVEVVRYLLTSPELKHHCNIQTNNNAGLIYACQNGNIGVINYLLYSDELTIHADITANNCDALRTACTNGRLEVVKLLLQDKNLINSYYLPEPTDSTEKSIKFVYRDAFVEACSSGHMSIMNTLLEDQNFIKYVDPLIEYDEYEDNLFIYISKYNYPDILEHLFNNYDTNEYNQTHKNTIETECFYKACNYCCSDVIEYFLQPDKLKNINLYIDNDLLFKSASISSNMTSDNFHFQMIQLFLYRLDYQISEELYDWLIEDGYTDIIALVDKKKQYENLSQDLPIMNENSKRNKI